MHEASSCASSISRSHTFRSVGSCAGQLERAKDAFMEQDTHLLEVVNFPSSSTAVTSRVWLRQQPSGSVCSPSANAFFFNPSGFRRREGAPPVLVVEVLRRNVSVSEFAPGMRGLPWNLLGLRSLEEVGRVRRPRERCTSQGRCSHTTGGAHQLSSRWKMGSVRYDKHHSPTHTSGYRGPRLLLSFSSPFQSSCVSPYVFGFLKRHCSGLFRVLRALRDLGKGLESGSLRSVLLDYGARWVEWAILCFFFVWCFEGVGVFQTRRRTAILCGTARPAGRAEYRGGTQKASDRVESAREVVGETRGYPPLKQIVFELSFCRPE